MTGAYATSCLALVALAWGVTELGAESYSDTERVTVIDLPVGVVVPRAPKNLSTADFEILVDGEAKTIVAYGEVAATDLQPYHALVYVDPALTYGRQLSASADLLLSAAEELTGLATVDVVMADPEPRFLLRESSDPEMLANALTASAWEDVAGDEIRALRGGFLEAIAEIESAEEILELAGTFAREETRLVQQRLDLLLSFLAEGGTPGKLRVLLLVGWRFDLDPSLFYDSWTDGEASRRRARTDAVTSLGASVRELAATLAAYGWVSLPMAPPEPESPLVPGLRIGKWRISGPAGGNILGVRIVRESERDPDLAEGLLENGEALLAQGKPEEARKAFKRALHHFYGDPRTAEQQARTLVGLSTAAEALGKEDEARSSMKLASEVDASVVAEQGETIGALLDPLAPLEVLAAESSGHIVQERGEMTAALAELGRRIRLSFQLAGEPTGDVLAVAVRSTRQGLGVVNPLWVRFGTPEMVATARMRLLMEGDPMEPTHELDARLAADPQRVDITLLELRLATGIESPDVELADQAACRLTLGTGSLEEGTQLIEHRMLDCTSAPGGIDVSEVLPFDTEFVAVLLEYLRSGAWGVNVVEREESY